MIYSMLNTMQSMQQNVLGLQNTVLNLVAEKNNNNKTEDNSLDTAMAAIRQLLINILPARFLHLSHQVGTIYNDHGMVPHQIVYPI